MSTITKEFTKEQLQQIIETDHIQCGEASALARIALASLEAEAVAEVCEGFTLRYIGHGPAPKSGVHIGDRLYTATPAPVSVPDEVSWEDVPEEITEDDMALASAWAHGFNQCRAAMLQGAEQQQNQQQNIPENIPFDQWLSQQTGTIDVECGCVMTEVFFHWLRVAYEAGKSPVIPDGWKLVPIDPTKDMLRAGQSVVGFWLNTVHCYSKMLAAAPAAPQQEVNNG